jgi:hypothetical protein
MGETSACEDGKRTAFEGSVNTGYHHGKDAEVSYHGWVSIWGGRIGVDVTKRLGITSLRWKSRRQARGDELALDERTDLMWPRLVGLDTNVLCPQDLEKTLTMMGYH